MITISSNQARSPQQHKQTVTTPDFEHKNRNRSKHTQTVEEIGTGYSNPSLYSTNSKHPSIIQAPDPNPSSSTSQLTREATSSSRSARSTHTQTVEEIGTGYSNPSLYSTNSKHPSITEAPDPNPPSNTSQLTREATSSSRSAPI
ncbi:hypothetical protein ACOSQ3_004077 [Xanthoceras sorbifolium]